jgi:hypothetical protein
VASTEPQQSTAALPVSLVVERTLKPQVLASQASEVVSMPRRCEPVFSEQRLQRVGPCRPEASPTALTSKRVPWVPRPAEVRLLEPGLAVHPPAQAAHEVLAAPHALTNPAPEGPSSSAAVPVPAHEAV